MKSVSQYQVSSEWVGRRLDQYLVSIESSLSRGHFQRLIQNHLVTVNQQSVKPSYQLKAGDLVHLHQPNIPFFPQPEKIPIEVIYEDQYILVVDKSPGITVHPHQLTGQGTLVQAILHHTKSILKAVYDPASTASRLRPGIVHRLDKDTSGLLVIAKTREALLHLAEQFRVHTVTKEYLALLYGKLEKAITVHTKLGRRKSDRKNLMVPKPLEGGGREATTHLQPQTWYIYPATGEIVSLVQILTETGRTHQIRIHCKYSGHSVLGDKLYFTKSSKTLSRKLEVRRQLLHANRLHFIHPIRKKMMGFEADLPQDIVQILTKVKAT